MRYLKPKFFETLGSYTKNQFIKDLIAGIIVAIIALPLSIALALASGVEPACGVYTAIFAGFTVSLLGGSSVQIAGPTAAFATVVATIVATQGMEGLILATLIAGLILVLMGVLKLGSLIRFIPCTITTGFTAGIAVTIFLGQIKDFLGLQYAPGVRPIETIEKIIANVNAIGTFRWEALAIGLISLLILIVYPRFEKRVPPSLIAVIVGALLVKLVPAFDANVFTISDLYTIPAGLPPFALKGLSFQLSNLSDIFRNAVTIAILAAIESLLSCVVADGMVNSKHNSNAELVAQGFGNIFSVLFGGIPATGAIARTAANAKNGGRTPVAGMIHALVLLLILLFLMPYAGLIPMPTIAAILFMVAFNMSERKKFVHLIKAAPKSDALVMLVTFVLTVVFDLVIAIEVGMVLVAVLFLQRMSSETKIRDVGPETEEGDAPAVRTISISGPLFFGVADKLLTLSPEAGTKCMVLQMQAVPAIDATAMNALEAVHADCIKKQTHLLLVGVQAQPQHALEKAGLIDKIGSDNILLDIEEALYRADRLIVNQ